MVGENTEHRQRPAVFRDLTGGQVCHGRARSKRACESETGEAKAMRFSERPAVPNPGAWTRQVVFKEEP